MFSNNFKYEIKLLVRSHWLLLLLLCMISLFSFATFNGNKNVEKRLQDISIVQAEFHKKDSTMLDVLTKLKNNESVDLPYWQLPSEPMTVGYRYPRLAVMKPDSFSFLATGQSDMYTHFKSPTVYGNNFALDYSEMVNPVQLLFGSFDMAFVIIYIIPLLIIAFTFNVLSKEKELGTLRLLAAQPISTIQWLLQKMGIRYVIFTAITFLSIIGVLVVYTPNVFSDLTSLLGLLALLAGYNLFWFVLSCVVNVKINNSSKNALALIGLWLVIALLIPATINQISSTLYPTPSRLKMINEIRLIKKENEEKQDELMDSYLRSHPELAKESNSEKFGFWHNYFASEKVMEEKTKPLLDQYEEQLNQQQNFIGIFGFLSPAILMQQSLNNIAGTSEDHYNDYKKQVVKFSEEWRNYLAPMLFKEEKISVENYNELPSFNYKNRIDSNFWICLIAILLISFVLFFQGIGSMLKRKSLQRLIQ